MNKSSLHPSYILPAYIVPGVRFFSKCLALKKTVPTFGGFTEPAIGMAAAK
jgi:hypothetical protein